MGLIGADAEGQLILPPQTREHLTSGSYFDISDYGALSADNPGVREIVERLTTNRAANASPEGKGAAFIYREGMNSAMEQAAAARRLTMALAGRAKTVAPLLATRVPFADARLMVDVGAGTGIYSIACLQQHPRLRAIAWDRPEVLKVAGEMAAKYGVADRLELVPGDMFADPVPASADVTLLSNILHDWDVPECRQLVSRCAAALPPGGRLLIHDAYLNDDLDGPLPIALYSAGLFAITEGRAYSAREYRGWLVEAGLKPGEIIPTQVHCGVLPASKA